MVLDGLAEALVHRKALVAPVARVAQAALLLEDDVAVLLLPGPDVLQEGLAPNGSLRSTPSVLSVRSTTFCVAMPAWSMPGIQSASKPCIRLNRMRRSWTVSCSAWPMWSRPVTLGGGMGITKGSLSPALTGSGWAWKKPPSSQ